MVIVLSGLGIPHGSCICLYWCRRACRNRRQDPTPCVHFGRTLQKAHPNHCGYLGRHIGEPRITSVVSPDIMRWVLGGSFLGMAIWTLIPDKIEEEETQVAKHLGVFGATFVTFFLAEMGDKTQIATIALAAHYGAPLLVIAGTTLGMLVADVPAVFVGNRFASKIPMKLVHSIAAGIFAVMGLLTLFQVDKLFQ